MKIIKFIWEACVSLANARYAADLARNGKYKEAQRLYK